MQPYPNYPYPYPPNNMINWFNPYYQNPEYMQYLNSRYFTQPEGLNYFPKEVKKNCKSNQDVIKIEEDSSLCKNQDKNISQQCFKKEQKKEKKKKIIAKILKGEKNIYLHPRKQVKNMVKYFDPNSAPSVTTSAYNLVQDTSKQDERNEKLSLMPEDVNQLEYPEQYQNLFITFRYRRIKKKFKKYIKEKDENYLTSKLDNSESENDQEDSSEYQFSQTKHKIKVLMNQNLRIQDQQVRKSNRNHIRHQKIVSLSQSKEYNEE